MPWPQIVTSAVFRPCFSDGHERGAIVSAAQRRRAHPTSACAHADRRHRAASLAPPVAAGRPSRGPNGEAELAIWCLDCMAVLPGASTYGCGGRHSSMPGYAAANRRLASARPARSEGARRSRAAHRRNLALATPADRSNEEAAGSCGLRGATDPTSFVRPEKAEPARGLGRLLEPGRWGRGGWGLDRVFSPPRRSPFVRTVRKSIAAAARRLDGYLSEPTSTLRSSSIATQVPELRTDCRFRNV